MKLAVSEPDTDKIMNSNSPVTDLLDVDPVYNTNLGAAFNGDSRDLLAQLPDDAIDLVVTSPPFALQHKKEYGNENQGSYNDWFLSFIPEIKRVLQPHGSLVIEIGGAYKRGFPERSNYQFELLNRLLDPGEGGMHLAQDFYWYNPAKLPNPIEWVNIRKIRASDAVTHIWWLSPEINKDSAVKEGEHPYPEASNQRVLQDYSESQQQIFESGEFNHGKRSSGWNIGSEGFTNENEGSIPDNLVNGAPVESVLEALDEVALEDFISQMSADPIEDLTAGDLLRFLGMGGPIADNMIEASNTASNTHYLKMCRQFGADAHPARFPRQIPEFFIDFLTPNPPYDDWDRGLLDRPIVLDIFAGSNITGQIAEFKDRYWLAFERERKYVEISQFRFLTEEEISKRYNDDQSDFGDFTPLSSD